jgi:MOSC domain-containing protein YiiM
VGRPEHDLTVRDVFRIYTRDRDECARLLAVPQMSRAWKRWAEDTLQRGKGAAKKVAEPGCCEEPAIDG